jgi:hypothetical protein
MQILRTLFPLRFPCPVCAEVKNWRKRGHANAGGTQYRLCLTCGREFKVLWSAREVCDQGRSYIVSRDLVPAALIAPQSAIAVR